MSRSAKLQIHDLQAKMRDGLPIAMITCYDYSMAHFVEEAGLDMVLVGDSLGMTLLGFDSTLPVTMDDMVRHAAAVRRGAPTRFVVGDLPYMSYQVSNEEAIRNAGRLMAQGGCDAVKLEGGREALPRVS
ncbi:MAG TPA: 3-methyl-2-oxobutanoate hydroxymethyltransferase, partial [Vicinamibacteria bacterium]